jgi:hypothetical protein
MVNLANPPAAYRWWRLPTDSVGLARMEFIIGNMNPDPIFLIADAQGDRLRIAVVTLVPLGVLLAALTVQSSTASAPAAFWPDRLRTYGR